MAINEVLSTIDKIVYQIKGEDFDIADMLYNVISEADKSEQPLVFQHACEIYGSTDSSESLQAATSKYYVYKDIYKSQLSSFVDAMLLVFLKQDLSEEAFYAQLWAAISESTILRDKGQRIYALSHILEDKRIPYFHLDASLLYSLSNDKFSELRKNNRRALQRITFILHAEFNQKTERASALLAELGISVPDEGADATQIDAYETRLMQMVQIIDRESKLKTLLDLLS